MANDNAKYTPTQWEKITAVAVAFFIVGLISFLVIRDRPFSDLNFAIFVRILLSLSCAILGAVIPGFLQVDMRKKGLVIRTGGALALFIVTFFFTPSVILPFKKSATVLTYHDNSISNVNQKTDIYTYNSNFFNKDNKRDRDAEDRNKVFPEKIWIDKSNQKSNNTQNRQDISENARNENSPGKRELDAYRADSVDVESKKDELIGGQSESVNMINFGIANTDTSFDGQKKALVLIVDFTDLICNSLPLEGSGSAVELNGQAKAELKGLLKKIGNFGIGGTGKYEETAWSGVLQKDIANILQKNVDCKLKIFELLTDRITSPAQDSSKPHADNAGENKKLSSGNLVVNGDFSSHWSEGWKKKVSDKTNGAIHVETVQSPNDPSDELLHLHLEGEGAGWVEQKVYIPAGKGIENLLVEFEMKTEMETTGFNLGEPIEAFFCVQFTDKDGKNLGQINFSAGKKGDFEDTGLYGAPSSLKSNNSMCIIKTNPQYHSVREDLYKKYIDCFSPNGMERINSLDLVAYLQTARSNQKADIYLDNVKMYYKD